MRATGPRLSSRPRRGRLAAGVCAGLEPVLGVPVGLLRFAFLLGALAGGVGIVAYLGAAAILPTTDAPPPRARRLDRVDTGAFACIVFGCFLLCRSGGLWFGDAIGFSGAVAAAGVALVWGRAEDRTVLLAGRGGPLRIALGVTLVIGGGLTFVAATGRADAGALGRSLAIVGVILVGLLLIVGPAVGRLFGSLSAERRRRIRSDERSEISAHLHDSVLQTLALIQLRSGDEREVQRLARRQERELRSWMLGRTPEAGATTVAAHVLGLAAALEDDLGARIEVVTVGDVALDDGLRALAQAAREAMLNAVRHAGVDRVDVFLEVLPEEVTCFVRDRGTGFDPATVDPERRGLSASVHGRMRRAGGHAAVRSTAGEGTEVELTMPRVGAR